MHWYYIVILTVVVLHIFNAIIVITLERLKKDTGTAMFLAAFPLFIILYIVFSPIRKYRANKQLQRKPKNVITFHKGTC